MLQRVLQKALHGSLCAVCSSKKVIAFKDLRMHAISMKTRLRIACYTIGVLWIISFCICCCNPGLC